MKKKVNVPEEIKTGALSEDLNSLPTSKKKRNWIKISIAANLVLLVGIAIALVSMEILHQSDTNPQFCASCHVMDSYVENYTSGTTLANVHAKAGVQCKECHSDYNVAAEIKSGINFITGNYDKTFPRRKFDDSVCTQCHISMDFVAQQTDFLVKNPHLSHNTGLKCRTCHISHGEQIDYCSTCHDNGGQRIIGEPYIPRANNPYDNYPDSGE